MSKMPALTPKEVCRILEHLGYLFIRQKGSHRVYLLENREIIVPMHTQALKRGTLANIIRATGLTPEQFLEHR